VVETLKRRSALTSVYVKGRYGANQDMPGTTVEERGKLTLVHDEYAADDPESALGLADVLGFALPKAGHSAAAANTRALWMGPGRWLVVGKDATYGALAQKIAARLPDAAINDVSSSRTVLRLTGPKVCDVLAAGCPMDLHPTKWAPGACATTIFDHFTVILDCIGANDFDVYVARGFAQSFYECLMEAGEEFGVEVA